MKPGSPEFVNELITRLRATHPDAHCALDYEQPHELLIATILSAQCTDARVNQVTPSLFQRYRSLSDFASADHEEIQQAVYATGFFRQKARYIQESSRLILLQFGGELPDTMNGLLTLPGVARKTANVVLGEIFHKAEGITVDTHVKRLAGRLGLTASRDPLQVEKHLIAVIPRENWIDISHLLIFHGRRVCTARNPDCASCVLNDLCPSAGKV